MTTNPIFLGTGGHHDGTYSPGSIYYSNVGLGRSAMIGSAPTTESYASQVIYVSGTISYLSWGVDTAFEPATLMLTLRQNSSNSDLAVSIAGSTTGFVTDSTDSVAVESGDTLDFAAHVSNDDMEYTYDDGFYCVSARFDVSSALPNAQLINCVGPQSIDQSATPQPICFLGILSDAVYEESKQQILSLVGGVWKNMACNIEINNTIDMNTITIVNRINDVHGSMMIAVHGDNTGYFEDTSDSDAIDIGDSLDYVIQSSSSPSPPPPTFELQWVGAHLAATDATFCMIGGSAGTQRGVARIYPGTAYTSLFGGGLPDTSQTRATGLIPYDLTASKLTVNVIAAGASCATGCTLFYEGSGSALSVSFPAGVSGLMQDAMHMVDCTQGYPCANQITVSGDSGDYITWGSATLLLQAS